MRFTCLKDHSGAAVKDHRVQEWKQMGPYLSLQFTGEVQVLSCFLESSLRPGWASVLKVTEPRLFVPGLAKRLGLLAYPVSLGTIWDTLYSQLPGLCGPSAGGMFDRGVHVFSKQTLIHVSRRNLQTDFCRLHPSEERWPL